MTRFPFIARVNKRLRKKPISRFICHTSVTSGRGMSRASHGHVARGPGHNEAHEHRLASLDYNEHFLESSRATSSKLQSTMSASPMKRSQDDSVPGVAAGPPCALFGIKNLFKYSFYNIHDYEPSVPDDPGSELTVADSCNVGYHRD